LDSSRFLISNWVPQAAVLGHPGVKAFVSHCGLDSLFEGLATGTPILAMPFGGDQPVNAQHVEDKGLGLKVGLLDVVKWMGYYRNTNL
jgi:UDP:flavonoid glycosyltransferase YjiC (YdhE family)